MAEPAHFDQNFEDFNYDEMSNDAACSQFYTVFNDLLDCGGGTPEDLSDAVDELVDTPHDVRYKKSALEEMVGYIMEGAAGSQMIHYMASELLAQLMAKFRREIEGESFALIVKRKTKESVDHCQSIFLKQTKEDVPAPVAQEGRNIFLFLANLIQKTLPIEPVPWPQMRPAVIFSILNTIKMSLDFRCSVRKEYLDNCACAVQALKIVGASVDEAIRKEPSIIEVMSSVLTTSTDLKFPDELTAMYENLRRMLISSTDLTPSLRAGILKILESRASRWGDVPSPDKPFDKDASQGEDEVDPVLYGPDNAPLTKEETEFCDRVAASEDWESYDEEEVDDQGELQVFHGEQGDYFEEPAQQFVWQREEIPDAALEDFRRMNLPSKTQGGGDQR